MNFISAPSPAWLGTVAAMSFAGLVLAAFASGYHLAIDPPPTKARALVSAPASDPDAVDEERAQPIHAGTVTEPLVDREQAVLRSEPMDGEIVDELPAGRRVTVSAQSGQWLFVRYERDGKAHEGWTHRVNIQPEDP
jgi:hypothetical protein